jgi:biopolymer transport protein ExbD
MNKLVTLDEFRKEAPLVVKKNPKSEIILNIQDTRNRDLKTVEEILKKEAGSRVIKYRQTMKFTPPETSDLKLPKRNTFSIQVGAKGKVFIGFDGQDNRRKLLTRMGEDYKIVFSPKELEEFSKIDSFGVPMNRMKAFLKMPAEERNKPENTIGIPYNSGNNEFKNWVRAARTVNKGMYVTFKGDPTTSYKVIDQLIETLQDLHENRYYMTFPMWSTAYEIAFPSKSKPEDDKTGTVKKFTESAVQDLAKTRPNVITVIPDKDNSIYYYLGTQDAKGNNPVLHKTDYSPSGIHEFLINRNHDVFAKVEALRKKKENGELSKEDFEKQRVEIMHDKSAPIVLIKPTDASNFGNFMNILYEMSICEMTRYAVIDLSAYDKNLISKAR